MNVVIIEDERLTAQRLAMLLRKYDPAIQVLTQLPSVAEAVEWLQSSDHPAPDLIFLDIHLEDDLGFRILEKTHLNTPVVFTTAYDEYMLQAFKVNSIDYLLKPINYDELVAAIEKFKSLQKQYTQPQPDMAAFLSMLNKPRETAYKDRFMVTIGTKIRSIETNDIAYFFFEEKATFLVTKTGTTLALDYSLDKLNQLIDPKRFFRVNRQFLVSLESLQTIHTYSGGKLKIDLTPKSRHEVFVSGDRVTDFKEWLGK